MPDTFRSTLLRRRRKILDRTFDPAFEDRLRKEMAKTELLRIYILVFAMSVAIVLGIINTLLFGNDPNLPIKKIALGPLLILFMVMIAYEVVNVAILIRDIKKRKPVSRVHQVLNLLIETSYPTLFVFVLFNSVPDVLVLFTPVLLVFFLFIVLSTLHLNFFMSLATGILSCFQYLMVSLYVLHHVPTAELTPALTSRLLLLARALFLLVCGGAAGFVALELRRRINDTFRAMNERRAIRQVLGQQVSYAVVDRIISEGKMNATERRDVCVMFLDVRNFTPFASGKDPSEVMDFQNQIFGIAIESVNKFNGIINQFLGDGFMATFGAPVSYDNDCRNAIDAALQILEQTQMACDRGVIPATRLGIGIHYGPAITGNIGTDVRKQYSIVGNVVIQASRIEQLNKEYHSQLLVSREALEQSKFAGGEPLGSVLLKGESKTVEIFKLL